ncbi:alpha/beta fold hydrolase [Paenibacillus yanchengensis]|uniref:Alpha/beta fold hydrolase n=1 Tax=Paenibacillus yanchengensis TaxID=2035833 RepID=A0ABW4YI28_9BACL
MDWIGFVVGILCVIVAVLIIASFYFYNVAIKRNKKQFLKNNKDLEQPDHPSDDVEVVEITEEHIQPTPVFDADWVNSQSFETWQLTSEDGLKLVGYYIPAKIKTNKTVLLAHGYTSQGKDMGGFAKFYYERLGYNVFMPDSRGHGASEGNYIGFGWIDRKDYLLWIKEVINKIGNNAQIVLHGISMGGAAVMMISGEKLPEQVKVIIEDCGYTSVEDELKYQLKRMYKLPSFPILQTTSLLTKVRAGYHFHEASSLKQLENNNTPMLFIHGDADTFVPSEMVWQVYDACKAEKDVLIIEGAAHGMAFSVGRSIYEKKVTEFIANYIN